MSTDNWSRDVLSRANAELDRKEQVLALPFLNFLDEFAREMPKVLKDGISSRQRDLDVKWKERLGRELEELRKRVPDPARTASSVSDRGRAFQECLSKEAANLVQALAKFAPLGGQAQTIINMTIAFEKKSEELEDIWADVRDDMSDLDQDLKKVVEDAQALADKAVEDAALRHKSALEQSLVVAEYVRKAPGKINIADYLGKLGTLIKLIAHLADTPGIVFAAKRKLWERCAKIESELAKRRMGILMFGEVRESTEAFVKEVNVDKSADSLRAALRCAGEAAASCKVAAQKTDVENISELFIDIMEDAHEELREAHDDFVGEYKGVFLGSVSSGTLQVILDKQRFLKPLDDVRMSRWNQALRELYEYDYVPVLLKHYNGGGKDRARQYLADEFDKVFRRIEQEARDIERVGVKLEDLERSLKLLEEQVD